MTGMGTFLTTVALDAPLINLALRNILFGSSSLGLGARAARERRHSLEIQYSCCPDSPGAIEVRP